MDFFRALGCSVANEEPEETRQLDNQVSLKPRHVERPYPYATQRSDVRTPATYIPLQRGTEYRWDLDRDMLIMPPQYRDTLPPPYRDTLPPPYRDTLPPPYRDQFQPAPYRDMIPPPYSDLMMMPPRGYRDLMPPQPYRDLTQCHYSPPPPRLDDLDLSWVKGSLPSQFPSARHRLKLAPEPPTRADTRSPGGYICSGVTEQNSPYVWPGPDNGFMPQEPTNPIEISVCEESIVTHRRPSETAKVPTFGEDDNHGGSELVKLPQVVLAECSTRRPIQIPGVETTLRGVETTLRSVDMIKAVDTIKTVDTAETTLGPDTTLGAETSLTGPDEGEFFESYLNPAVCWEESEPTKDKVLPPDEPFPSSCVCQVCANPSVASSVENQPNSNPRRRCTHETTPLYSMEPMPAPVDSERKVSPSLKCPSQTQMVNFVHLQHDYPPKLDDTKDKPSEKETQAVSSGTSEGKSLAHAASSPLKSPQHVAEATASTHPPPLASTEESATDLENNPTQPTLESVGSPQKNALSTPKKAASSSPKVTLTPPKLAATVSETASTPPKAAATPQKVASPSPKDGCSPRKDVSASRKRLMCDDACCGAFKTLTTGPARTAEDMSPMRRRFSANSAPGGNRKRSIRNRELESRALGHFVKRPESSAHTHLHGDRTFAAELRQKGPQLIGRFVYLDRGLYAVLWRGDFPSPTNDMKFRRSETTNEEMSVDSQVSNDLMHSRVSRAVANLPNNVFCYIRVRIEFDRVLVSNLGRKEVISRLGTIGLRKWLTERNTFFTRQRSMNVRHRRALSLSCVQQPIVQRSKSLPSGGEAPWRRGEYEPLDAFLNFYKERTTA